MKRLINLRISLVCAISFVLGIFAFYEVLFADIWFDIAAVALLTVLFVTFVCKRTKYMYVVLLALIFLLLGFGRSCLGYASMSQNEVCGKQTVISGRVTDLGLNGSNSYVLYLDDCTDGQGNRYGGTVRVVYPTDELPQTGDIVTFDGVLYSVYPLQSDVDSFSIRNNVRYELKNATLVDVGSGGLKFDEIVRKYIYGITTDYMPDNSGVMYALLTGDRSALDGEEEWAFNRAGVAHLLAVSGLHVGFVAAVVCFILRRFKLHPAVECAIVVAPLLFYAYVCNFTPSVMRAVVMLVCSYLSRILFSRYDMLTSIAWAALVTLCICPFYLFDVGFQLSFLSVYGIATVYAALNRSLRRKNVNKHLARFIEAVGVSSVCALATFFAMAAHGMEISLFGPIFNLIAIPLVSVAFVLGLFGMIPWVFHYLTVAADALLQFVKFCATNISQLSFATVSVAALSLAVIVACVIMFGIGGYIYLSKRGKRIFYPICSILLILCFVFAAVPVKTGSVCYVCQTESESIVVAISESETALVGDFADFGATSDAVEFVSQHRHGKITLYIAHYSDALLQSIMLIDNKLTIDKIYLMGTDANVQVDEYIADKGIVAVRQYPNMQVGSGVKVRSLHDAGLVGAVVDCDEIRICIAYGERGVQRVTDFGLGADVYVLPAAIRLDDAEMTTLTPLQSDLPHNYGANKYGNFTIRRNSAKILLCFR